MTRPTPGSEELAHFGLYLRELLQRRRNAWFARHVYCPARLTQLPDLPNHITRAPNDLSLVEPSWLYGGPAIYQDAELRWLDLSQIEVNPYFRTLFAKDGRFQHRMGRWEINLRSAIASTELVVQRNTATASLLGAIGSMPITNPPSRCLCVYHCAFSVEGQPGNNELLARICNDDGISISELVNVLENVAPTVLSTWRREAQNLYDRVARSHWIDDIWFLPGKPRIRIYLDNVDMSTAYFDFEALLEGFNGLQLATGAAAAKMGYNFHPTRVAYMVAEPFRAEREGEWLPEELFEPMETETGRHKINWDT
jgi:hypothetical protein